MLIEYGNTVVCDTWELNEETPTGYSRIYYVLEGDVTYEAADGRQTLKPGYLYALPSTEPYHVWRNKSKDFACTYLHVDFSNRRGGSGPCAASGPIGWLRTRIRSYRRRG